MLRDDDDSLKVGAVAKAAGVGVQTLHYYERLGLLPKPNRSAANYRLYPPDAVRRVLFIKKAQAISLTLEETKQILDLKDHGRQPCRQVAELGEKHLREIDARLKQLRTYRQALARAVVGCRRQSDIHGSTSESDTYPASPSHCRSPFGTSANRER